MSSVNNDSSEEQYSSVINIPQKHKESYQDQDQESSTIIVKRDEIEENVMFSSYILNEYSILKPRKTRKQILEEMSFETEAHNIYNPQYSDSTLSNSSQVQIEQEVSEVDIRVENNESPEISIVDSKKLI